ncbi:MAG TPA: biopolymer transporter ExbD [Bacteroidia bacterium]|nr:biopolymer transporter ExbD [Bacteroidia bacterium]
MPKIQVPRSSPQLDMTPMVDLAFLLVTFFMLTATMRAPEPVLVDTPSSISEMILPKNHLLITIDTSGRVFLNMENKEIRMNMLKAMNNKFPKAKFTDEQIQKFGAMQSFGVPLDSLGAYIAASPEQRKFTDQRTGGIPVDTANVGNDQLYHWVQFAREQAEVWKKSNPKLDQEPLRIALKADGKTQYKKIDMVVGIFKKQGVHSFNLITDLESDPNNPTENALGK